MKSVFFKCILLLSLVFVGQQVFSQKTSRPRGGAPGSWRLLGTVSASHSADHDAIFVKGPHDYFRKLKFKVTDAPVNIHRMVVTYDGGAPENINIRFIIPKNGESRVLDLRGGSRKLRSVEFWYDTKGILNGKADLTLFGMK